MKKLLLLTAILISFLTVSNAQEIAVQATDGSIVTYTDLNKAIYNAPAGATIYLPAGNLLISDTINIKKKLTIIGVGYKTSNQGSTMVGGNFHFDQGCDGSSLLGIHLTGDVRLAYSGSIKGFLLRFCSINSLIFGEGWMLTSGVVVNQNLIRGNIDNNQTEGVKTYSGSISLTNNIIHFRLIGLNGGIVDHNIFLFNVFSGSGLGEEYRYSTFNIVNTTFSNNVFFATAKNFYDTNSCIFNNNIGVPGLAANFQTNDELKTIFVNGTGGFDGDYHIKPGMVGKNAGTDGTDVGIYGGTGFSDEALAPIPRIIQKNIPNQTDADGNLKISIKVKAAQ